VSHSFLQHDPQRGPVTEAGRNVFTIIRGAKAARNCACQLTPGDPALVQDLGARRRARPRRAGVLESTRHGDCVPTESAEAAPDARGGVARKPIALRDSQRSIPRRAKVGEGGLSDADLTMMFELIEVRIKGIRERRDRALVKRDGLGD
jgi:hypothetical protein